MADDQEQLVLGPSAKRTRFDDAIDTSQQVSKVSTIISVPIQMLSSACVIWLVHMQGVASRSEARAAVETFGKLIQRALHLPALSLWSQGSLQKLYHKIAQALHKVQLVTEYLRQQMLQGDRLERSRYQTSRWASLDPQASSRVKADIVLAACMLHLPYGHSILRPHCESAHEYPGSPCAISSWGASLKLCDLYVETLDEVKAAAFISTSAMHGAFSSLSSQDEALQ